MSGPAIRPASSAVSRSSVLWSTVCGLGAGSLNPNPARSQAQARVVFATAGWTGSRSGSSPRPGGEDYRRAALAPCTPGATCARRPGGPNPACPHMAPANGRPWPRRLGAAASAAHAPATARASRAARVIPMLRPLPPFGPRLQARGRETAFRAGLAIARLSHRRCRRKRPAAARRRASQPRR